MQKFADYTRCCYNNQFITTTECGQNIFCNRTRTLTADAFHAFLVRLSPQKIEDGEAYEKARHRLIIFFASRQCREHESLADKTIDIAIRKMAEIPAEAKPIAYLFGIAKNVFREYLRDVEKDLTAIANSHIYRSHSQLEVERNHPGSLPE